LGKLSELGYGFVEMKRQQKLVHRVIYELIIKPIPAGLFCCHSCDNPSCVNPFHMFIGTHQDNMEDMCKKGRNVKGERQGHSKLTVATVVEMRREYAQGGVRLVDLARRFGVSIAAVSYAIRGDTWKFV